MTQTAAIETAGVRRFRRRASNASMGASFFVIAIIAAVFGFGGIALAAAGIAKLLFFIFLVLFLVALLGGLVRRA